MSGEVSHGTILNSIITALVAMLPADTFGYLEKLVSVLILAMAAEVGRRLIAILWRKP